MLYRLLQRSTDESGFTLVELLVVVLIVGILAAVAIVSLLGQTNKAYDASAKALAGSAQTAAETIATDNDGSYAKVTKEEINAYEQSIPIEEKAANGGAWLSEATETEKGSGYKLVVTAATTKDRFEIVRKGNSEVERRCTEVHKEDHACPAGTW